jgi:hypothetical protein
MDDPDAQKFFNLLRLLDVMSAEPAYQFQYMTWRNFPDPVGAVGELFEDLQGYEAFLGDMEETGDLHPDEEALFRGILRLSERIDATPGGYSRERICADENWRKVRDAALLLKLSLSSHVPRNREEWIRALTS